MKKDIKVYVEDMLEAIEAIESYIKGYSMQDFFEDKKTQDAVIRRLEIIGEAAKNIGEEIRAGYPHIPWKEIAGMRDVLIHAYAGVNIKRVWKAVSEDTPGLKEKLEKVREEIEETDREG